MALANSRLRKRDIEAMSRKRLVALVWQLAKETDETVTIFGQGHPDRRDLCVISGDQVLGTIEGMALD